MFSNKIKQLLFSYPLDRVTDSGTPFWSGAKKPPAPLVFNIEDPLHFEFVVATSLMRAKMYGIVAPPQESFTIEALRPVLEASVIPAFRFALSARIDDYFEFVFRPSDAVKYSIVEEELKRATATAKDKVDEPPTKKALTSGGEDLSSHDFEADCRNLIRFNICCFFFKIKLIHHDVTAFWTQS